MEVLGFDDDALTVIEAEVITIHEPSTQDELIAHGGNGKERNGSEAGDLQRAKIDGRLNRSPVSYDHGVSGISFAKQRNERVGDDERAIVSCIEEGFALKLVSTNPNAEPDIGRAF